MTQTKWTRNSDWVGSQIEDSFIMLSISNGHYVALNQTARAIWDALETPATSTEIETSLLAQFEVEPDVCAAAVQRVLQDMEANKIAHPA